MLPLESWSIDHHLKHSATFVSLVLIVFLGLFLWWRTKQPWWAVFSIAYSWEIPYLFRLYTETGIFPLFIAMRIEATEASGTIIPDELATTVVSTFSSTTSTSSSTSIWDPTAVLVALALLWVSIAQTKKGRVEPGTEADGLKPAA